MLSSTGSIFSGASCSMGGATSVYLASPGGRYLSFTMKRFYRVLPNQAPAFPGRDLLWNPGTHDLPQDEVSDLEISAFNFRDVMLGHEILVPCQPLFSCCFYFTYQVQLQAHGFVVPILIIVLHSIACKSDLSQDNGLTPICQSKQHLSCRCPGHHLVRSQYAW